MLTQMTANSFAIWRELRGLLLLVIYMYTVPIERSFLYTVIVSIRPELVALKVYASVLWLFRSSMRRSNTRKTQFETTVLIISPFFT